MSSQCLTLCIRKEKGSSRVLDHEVEECDTFDVEFGIFQYEFQCLLSLDAAGLQMSGEPEVDHLELSRMYHWMSFLQDFSEVVVECTGILCHLCLLHR